MCQKKKNVVGLNLVEWLLYGAAVCVAKAHPEHAGWDNFGAYQVVIMGHARRGFRHVPGLLGGFAHALNVQPCACSKQAKETP